MKSLGTYLLVFGLGSIVLYFLDMNFRFLMWIENWGPAVAWAIRIGLAVLGAILFFVGKGKETQAPAA